MTAGQLDLAAALRDPGRYFSDPRDIVKTAELDRDTKLKLLDEWERDARGLAVAEEEGLDGGEAPMLARIRNARRELAVPGDTGGKTGGGATKHG